MVGSSSSAEAQDLNNSGNSAHLNLASLCATQLWSDCYSCAGELSLLVQQCWRAFSLGSAVLESFLSWFSCAGELSLLVQLCWRAFSLGSAVLESFLSWFSCAGELSLLVQLCWRAFSLGCAGELSLLAVLESFLSWFSCAGELSLLVQLLSGHPITF